MPPPGPETPTPVLAPVLAREAATIVHVRDARHGDGSRRGQVEVFCVERHRASAFLGGALVFPGGKVDPIDHLPVWRELALGDPLDPLRVLKIAACRETLEEGALLHVRPIRQLRHPDASARAMSPPELLALRKDVLQAPARLPALLAARGLALDLTRLVPFARWVTPTRESYRFDTHFFLAKAPPGQEGAHDERETTSSFWATPAELLSRFEAGEVQLAPPTHHTLQLFVGAAGVDDAFSRIASASLAPILPEVAVDANGLVALVLPGDPAHSVRAPVRGPLRYELRDGRFLPANPA